MSEIENVEQKNLSEKNNQFVIFNVENDKISVDVRFEGETVWLTQAQLAELFQTSRPNITMHIKNILGSGELEENMVSKNFLHTTEHGAIAGKNQTKEVKYYNLDMIISLGYRINSKTATKFRQWATVRLKEYMIKGFTIDDERRTMRMQDYIKQLDAILSADGRKLLDNAGTVSHNQAIAKAHTEYKKYVQKTLSPIEQEYLSNIKMLSEKGKDMNKKK